MKLTKFNCPFALSAVALTVQAFSASHAHALEIDVGNPDVAARLDTTIKYSLAARVRQADPVLLGNPNTDDGDRNFNRGLISNRLDLFSEFDAIWKNRAGIRLSGAAYYDQAYNSKNDNPGLSGGAFPNQLSVPYNEFPDATRRLHGRKAELLDAFVFSKFDLGDMSGTVRAGRHGVLWGESLFFGGNAIAGGQMPVDVVKLLSVPNTQFKEAIRPLPQISGQIQLSSDASVGAYLQTSWAPNVLPAVGSYLSSVDAGVDGGETLFLGRGIPPALRQSDLRPSRSGQGGLQLKTRWGGSDFGFYAIRFHSKTPQSVPTIAMSPGGPLPAAYRLVYQEGISAIGASATHTFGEFNVAIEGSVRHNQDLASTRGVDGSLLTGGPASDNLGNPGYAVGKTAHINVSTLATLPSTFLWREASFLGEIAWNRVLKITKNPAAIDPNGTRDGVALRMVLEPTYRAVLPGVDISVPIGIGWAPKGSRPLAAGSSGSWIPEGGGDLSIGINGSFRDSWRFSVSYTRYFGKAAPLLDSTNAYSWKQTFRDRDFIAASLRHSF